MPKLRKWIVGDAFLPANTDLNYYRDKYLSMLLAWALLFSFGHIEQGARAVALRGFLVSSLAILLARHRWLILGVATAFMGALFLIAFGLRHKPFLLLPAAVCGAIFYAITKLKGHTFGQKPPRKYGVLELAIDMPVFLLIIYSLKWLRHAGF